MGSKAKKSKALAAAATELISEVGTSAPKRRRGRALLLLGLAGVGAALFKATRDAASPAPAPVPAPAAKPAQPAQTAQTAQSATPAPADPAPVAPLPVPVDVITEPEPVEQLETEAPPVAPVEPEAVAPVEVDASTPEVAPKASALAEELPDIVEEPWAGAQVTPVDAPPADSLTSFFDEVMTDTAERKLRKGQ